MLKLRCLHITYLWPRRCGWFLNVKNSLLLTRTMPNKILYTSNMIAVIYFKLRCVNNVLFVPKFCLPGRREEENKDNG